MLYLVEVKICGPSLPPKAQPKSYMLCSEVNILQKQRKFTKSKSGEDFSLDLTRFPDVFLFLLGTWLHVLEEFVADFVKCFKSDCHLCKQITLLLTEGFTFSPLSKFLQLNREVTQ